MRQVVKIFKALSDPNRLRILMMLSKRTLCVCEITEILGLATSTVSKHLSILKEAGLITADKEGKWVNYQINNEQKDTPEVEILIWLRKWLQKDEQITKDTLQIELVDRINICNNDPN